MKLKWQIATLVLLAGLGSGVGSRIGLWVMDSQLLDGRHGRTVSHALILDTVVRGGMMGAAGFPLVGIGLEMAIASHNRRKFHAGLQRRALKVCEDMGIHGSDAAAVHEAARRLVDEGNEPG